MKSKIHEHKFLTIKEMSNNLIIKIALSIVVIISTFGLQSCKKESSSITPTTNTIIGKWRSVSGNNTLEREFIKGANSNSGTGISKFTTITFGSTVQVTTEPFTWVINGNGLAISQIADIAFIFEITNNGNRLILFDEVNRDRVSFTFERIN